MTEGRPTSAPELASLPLRKFDCRGGREIRVDRHGRLWRVALYEPRRANDGSRVTKRWAAADEDLGFAVARVLDESNSALFREPLIRYLQTVMEEAP